MSVSVAPDAHAFTPPDEDLALAVRVATECAAVAPDRRSVNVNDLVRVFAAELRAAGRHDANAKRTLDAAVRAGLLERCNIQDAFGRPVLGYRVAA